MNLYSIKRGTTRRANRLHVLHREPKFLRRRRHVKTGAITLVSFILHGESGRDYILELDPHDIETMAHKLERLREAP